MNYETTNSATSLRFIELNAEFNEQSGLLASYNDHNNNSTNSNNNYRREFLLIFVAMLTATFALYWLIVIIAFNFF